MCETTRKNEKKTGNVNKNFAIKQNQQNLFGIPFIIVQHNSHTDIPLRFDNQ